MADPRHTPPPDDLERELADLGQRLDWPEQPGLLPAIRKRIEAQASGRVRSSGRSSRPAWVRFALASAALVLIGALILIVSNTTRTTVADRLGLPGLSISTDPTSKGTSGGGLQIGTSSTLDAAVARVGPDLIMPPDDVLGAPDEIYMLDRDGVVQVSYVYLSRSDLPDAGETGIGLLISQFDGKTNASFIQKQLGADTSLELTEVNQQPAFWLSGAPHEFFYERDDGTIQEETFRLAANVLVWEQGGMTVRIESALDRDRVIQLAEAMSARGEDTQ